MRTVWKVRFAMEAAKCRKASDGSPETRAPARTGWQIKRPGKRKTSCATDTARETAFTSDGWLWRRIETQAEASALFALGIGWPLGRMHRPL
jgi:hypothetical protein